MKLKLMLKWAVISMALAIRYPKGNDFDIPLNHLKEINLGKWEEIDAKMGNNSSR